MANVVFQVDATKATSSIEQFNEAVRKSGAVVGDFVTKTVQLNEQGQIASGAIDQMSASGRRLTTTFEVLAGAAKIVGATAREAGEQGAAAGQAFGVSWQGLVRILEVQLFRRAVTSIVNATRDGITSAIQYQIQLQQVANVTNQSGSNLDAFSGRVRALSEQFGIDLFAGLGAAQIALTGQLGNAANGFEVLTQAMRLSQATGTDVSAATRLITTSLEAFHLQADQATRVANVLFLTAQRSRIPLDETQAAIGRVSQTASALGLSFEQVTSLFLTISQQGGRPTEAFSLLNQVMNRLVNPSQKLQEFLNSLGTPTARLAQQTFGLVGFLQRLNEAAQRSPELLGDMAGSVRTLGGLLALTGDSTRRFQENFEGLTQAGGQLTAGVNRVQQTPAQQLRNEFERIKNIFAQDIGQSFIKAVVDISKALGGAQAVTEGFVAAVKTLGLAFGALRLGQMALGFVTLTAQIQAAGVAASTTGIQAASIGAGLGSAFLAGIALHQLLKGIAATLEAARVSHIVQLVQNDRAVTERANEQIRNSTATQIRAGTTLVEGAYRQRLQNAASVVRIAGEQRDVEINAHKEVAEAFRIASASFLDTLRNRISQTTEAINRDKNAQLQSLREVQAFRQQIEGRGFQRQLSVEQDPAVAASLLQNRIRQRLSEAQGIFTNRDASQEEITRARAIFQEIDQLQGDLFTRENELGRLRAEQQGLFSEEVRNGQLVRVLRIDMTAAQQRDNVLINERNRLETQYRAALAAREADERKSLATQQTRLRIFESLLRQQEQFRVFNITEQGARFIPQFQTAEDRRPGGGREAALAEFNRQAEVLRETASAQGLDITQINTLIEQRRAAITREIDATNVLAAATANLNNLAQRRTTDEQQISELIQRRANLVIGLAAQTSQANDLLVNFGGSLRSLAPRVDPSTLAGLREDAPVRQAASAYNALLDRIEEARQAQLRFAAEGGRTQANAQALALAIGQVNAAIRPVQELQGTGAARTLGLESLFTDTGFFTLLQRFQNSQRTGIPQIERLIGNVINAFGPLTELGQIEQQLRALQQRLQEIGNAQPGAGIAQNFNNAGQAAATAETAMTQALDNARTAAMNLNTQLGTVLSNFSTLGSITGLASTGGVAGVGFAAGGGIAGQFPGAPRGTDVLPYWLTPGEFIMPASQTARFFTQLMSMRSGIQPKYAAEGGPVTVGDIHVSVVGGGPTEKTIRDIGRGLDREIRRGTIRLGRSK